jgi:hypothetical protein
LSAAVADGADSDTKSITFTLSGDTIVADSVLLFLLLLLLLMLILMLLLMLLLLVLLLSCE